MADEARTSLIFDATGAKTGAAEFAAASEKVIASEKAIAAAAEKSAGTVDQSEVQKAAARSKGATSAKGSAEIQAAAARAAGDAVVTASDRIVKSTSAQIAVLDRYARSWDPLTAAVQRAQKQFETLNDIATKTSGPTQARALDMVSVAADRLATAQRAAAAGTKLAGDSAGSARFATQQLGVQTVQFFSAIQAGQPFLQAFIGQAHQIVDVSLATGTGFRTLTTGIGSMFAAAGRWVAANPLTVALVAGTAAMAALGAMAESTARRLEGVKNVLSGVRPDFQAATAASEELAKRLAATTPLTTSQARGGSLALFQAGFSGTTEQGVALVKVFADLSKVLGENEPKWDRIAVAMRDPAALMQSVLDQSQKLGKSLLGLNQPLIDEAKRLQAAGDYAGSAAIAMRALQQATAGVAGGGTETPLEKALKRLEEAFTKTGQAGRSFADTIGTAMTDAAAWVVNGVAKMIPALQGFIDHLAGRGNPATSSGDVTSGLSATLQTMLGAHGAVPTVLSSAGAMGIMQLMPATAAGMNVNPFVPSENILGGLKYIQQLATQMQHFPGGLEAGVTRAYAAGPHGNLMGASATSEVEKVAAADISKLPTDTASMIDYWGRVLNLPPDLITLGKRIAMVESGGHQGPTNATQPFVAPPGSITTVAPAGTGTGTGAAPAVLPQPSALEKIIDEANAYVKSLNLVVTAQDEFTRRQKLLQTALAASSLAGNTANVIKYSTALQALSGEQYRAISPQQEFIKGLKQQAEAAQIVTEGDRSLAEALAQLNEINKQHPETADSVRERAQVTSAVLERLSGEFKRASVGIDQQIEAQQRLTAAYEVGYAAVTKAVAANAAYAESLKLPVGLRAAAVEGLTQKLLDQAKATQQTAASQLALQNQDSLTYIQRETDTIGMNSDARTLNLAHLKAEQELRRTLPNLTDAETASLLKQSDQINKNSLELANHQHALDTVASAFETSFDTIGNAITNALVSGQGAAVNFRNVMTSVAQQILQQFLKLAVINPLMNSLFGGKRDTLFGVFDELNKTTPGSSSSSSEGGGGTGILGGLFSTVASIGGLFGGGSAVDTAIGRLAGDAPSMGGSWFSNLFSGAGGNASALASNTSSFGTLGGAGLYHSGGIVGANDNRPMATIPAQTIASVPRFHNGLMPDEFAAVLMRGERVLTARQDNALRHLVGGMAEQLAAFKGTGTDGMPRFHGGNGAADFSSIMRQGQQALASQPAPGAVAHQGDNVTITNTIDARGATEAAANTFRRSLPQIASLMSDQMARAKARNG